MLDGFRLDPGDARPQFRQIRDAIRDAVRTGHLSPGARLTPTRALAATLGRRGRIRGAGGGPPHQRRWKARDVRGPGRPA